MTINEHNIEEIYLEYFPRLVRFAQEYVISDEDAKNIVQDVFLVLWEKREDLAIQLSLTSYLFVLIKNKCIDHLRRRKNASTGHKQLQESFIQELNMKRQSLEVFDQLIISDDHIIKIIQDAISSLPEKCREIFIRNKLKGKKYNEIAKELNISVNTVENQMGIALKKLRKKLKNYAPLFTFLYFYLEL